MIVDTLSNNPQIGLATTFGSVIVSWFEVMNPIMSFVSLCIGVAVGIVTLILQIKKLRNQ